MDPQLRNAIFSGRRSVWLSIFAAVCFGALALAFYTQNNISFDPHRWQTDHDARRRMLKDLLGMHNLVGASREDVNAMLGVPDGKRDLNERHTYTYWAGSDGVIDDNWLVLELKNDAVVSMRVTPD